MSDYFLGVDGGQSSTIAIVGDARGQRAGGATAGPCNHVGAAEGRAKFLRVMGECCSQAAAKAGLRDLKPRFKAAYLGMSGGPDDKAALLAELIDAERLVVTHDAKIAWAGATEGEPGVVVIAGTGSIAYGENAQGESARAGGWGYIYGDEGSGFDIARQALRAALREYEGWGPRTALTPALVELIGAVNANDGLHRLYTAEWPRARVAELAINGGPDRIGRRPIATEFLRGAAQQLAMLAASVRRLISNEALIRMSWIGGVFQSQILARTLPDARIAGQQYGSGPAAAQSAAGALLLAYRVAGLPLVPQPFHGIKK